MSPDEVAHMRAEIRLRAQTLRAQFLCTLGVLLAESGYQGTELHTDIDALYRRVILEESR